MVSSDFRFTNVQKGDNIVIVGAAGSGMTTLATTLSNMIKNKVSTQVVVNDNINTQNIDAFINNKNTNVIVTQSIQSLTKSVDYVFVTKINDNECKYLFDKYNCRANTYKDYKFMIDLHNKNQYDYAVIDVKNNMLYV